MNDKALIKLEEAATSLKRQDFHPSRELAITLVNAAHHALLNAQSDGNPTTAHEVRKKLKTIEDWFKLQRARLIDSNLVVAERLRAERVVGGMLANGVQHQGGRPKKRFPEGTVLPDGITKKDSHKWQRAGDIADADFEQWVMDMTASEQEISTAALLRLWRELFGQESPETPPLPDGIFNVIYADPPWEYNNSGFDQSVAQHYSTLSTPDICQLPISGIAAEDSALFLWTTSPMLPDGLEVMKAWGFEYKASMVWIKNHAPGIRFWLNTRHEFLLIGSRGSFLPEMTPDSVIEAPVERHSQKPEIVYETIEKMYPDSKRIELFARENRSGWKAWGNEVNDQ